MKAKRKQELAHSFPRRILYSLNVKTNQDMKKRILWMTAALLAAAGMTNGLYAQTGVKYPYVTTNSSGNKCVIVSRDAQGGVKSALLHANWTTATPAHNHSDEPDGTAKACNAVSAKFEVYSSDNATSGAWADAAGKCPSGWRLPTQRELILISVMKDQFSGITGLASASYWSATEYSTTSAWYFGFSTNYTNYATKTNTAYYVRCVRDL